jgi:hypothetical protein
LWHHFNHIAERTIEEYEQVLIRRGYALEGAHGGIKAMPVVRATRSHAGVNLQQGVASGNAMMLQRYLRK